MDIVVPYRQDAHNGLELRFAMRSIEKYLTGYRHIYLIGDKPDWFTGNHIAFPDYEGRKEFSIKEKIRSICLHEISDNFLMWHDDHFLLKPLDVSEIKYWYDKPLKDLLKDHHKGYGLTIKNTLEIFPDALNFDIHCPIVFNKQAFTKAMVYQSEICFKSYYCRLWANHETETEQMQDLKLNRPMVRGEILAKIAGRLFFSTGSMAMIGEMVEVFDELYPEKSKCEK